MSQARRARMCCRERRILGSSAQLRSADGGSSGEGGRRRVGEELLAQRWQWGRTAMCVGDSSRRREGRTGRYPSASASLWCERASAKAPSPRWSCSAARADLIAGAPALAGSLAEHAKQRVHGGVGGGVDGMSRALRAICSMAPVAAVRRNPSAGLDSAPSRRALSTARVSMGSMTVAKRVGASASELSVSSRRARGSVAITPIHARHRARSTARGVLVSASARSTAAEISASPRSSATRRAWAKSRKWA